MSVVKKRIVLAATIILLLGGATGAGLTATRNGWVPSAWLSVLIGTGASGQPVEVGLFCKEHGVPEKFCTLCHAELRNKLPMCQKHGVPEELCTICHPENAQKYGLNKLCAAHGLPEAFCPQCHAAGEPGGLTPRHAGTVESDWCAEHGVPESLCILCDPQRAKTVPMCQEHGVPKALCTICEPALKKNFVTCDVHGLPVAFCPKDGSCRSVATAGAVCQLCAQSGKPCDEGECAVATTGRKVRQAGGTDAPAGSGASAVHSMHPRTTTLSQIRLASPDVAEKAGITTAPIERRKTTETITANCEVDYDETRLAHVRPRVSGIVHEVKADVGNMVVQGDLLAVVDSAELGQAKADYLAALPMVELWQKNVSRLKGLEKKGIVAGKDLLQAEAELARAEAEVIKVRQRLRNFGLMTHEIAVLADESEDRRNLLSLVSPQAGTVIQRHAVRGEAVQAMTELLTVADLSRVWVHADIYEKDLDRIRVGQTVTVRVRGLLPRTFTGRVSWIGSEVDPRTRTIRARADVENTGDWLRANMFGEAEIQVGEPAASLLVPKEAVQWEGTSYVVFVQQAPDLFQPRRVLRGRDIGDLVQLVWADRLEPGDRVVTTGSFLLKTELHKGAIGGGCCAE